MEHPRQIIHKLIPLEVCKELEFIHKSNCTVGYRPNVFSTTLSHLIATNCPHLIIPFVSVREKLKEKVEEFFDCEYELFIEFTGLISWAKGASIGWHSDDNRPYLKQRDYAVIDSGCSLLPLWPCLSEPKDFYLRYGEDFQGGLFHFQDGEPETFAPTAGDVVMYTADSQNIHAVDEITSGERLTLTLWFTRDRSHDEDVKLVSLLSDRCSCNLGKRLASYNPFPASSNMYWFPSDQDSDHGGFDIRYARLLILGYGLYSQRDCPLQVNFSYDFSELVMRPLQLVKGDELFMKEFVNILHALQAVQFFYWKSSELSVSEDNNHTNVIPLSSTQKARVLKLKSEFVKDMRLVEAIFGGHTPCGDTRKDHLDWIGLSIAMAALEAYTCKLIAELHNNLPFWKSNKSIFTVPEIESQE